MARRNSDSGRQAVIWLATAYTALIGTAAVAFVILVFSEQPQIPLIVLGSTLAVLTLLVVILNLRWEEPLSHLRYWLLAQDRSDPTDDYRAARRRIRAREQFGDNEPPSVDSIRDAANHGGAWVPRSTSNPRTPKKS